jgi:predicted O-methyltransferase YrrM
LELGVWMGRTSSYLISVLPGDGKYCGVDIEDNRTEEVKELMEGHTFLLGQSIDLLPTLSGNYFDLIFIDSVHEYDYLQKEFPLCKKLLKEGGIIALHDYYIDGVKKYVDELEKSGLYYLIPLLTYDSDLFNRGLVLVKPK